MRKLIVAGIAFVLLLGGFIVYMEIDKKKFIDSISSVSPVVNQPVNVSETIIEGTQANEGPKLQEVDTAELLAAVNRIPEQFGYSEAATTYAKLEAKQMSGEELTIDEKVTRLEAMLYLYPNEGTRRSLIYHKWLQSKGLNSHPTDGVSDEAELKELGIPVVHMGNVTIINPPPDVVVRRLAEESPEETRHIWRDFLSHGESSPPASDTVFSEGIGEDTDFLQRRSEVFPVMPEPKISVTTEHVHQKDRHVHEPPTIQPPIPTAAKGIEAGSWEGLSPEQRGQAKQLFDQYGTEEGLRRLREMDPDAAERFESDKSRPPFREQAGRERRPAPSRDAPDGGQSESGSQD